MLFDNCFRFTAHFIRSSKCLSVLIPISFVHTEEFSIGEGVFLMIGYSKKEEELLRPWTHQDVRDTIPRLRKIYDETQETMNGVSVLSY